MFLITKITQTDANTEYFKHLLQSIVIFLNYDLTLVNPPLLLHADLGACEQLTVYSAEHKGRNVPGMGTYLVGNTRIFLLFHGRSSGCGINPNLSTGVVGKEKKVVRRRKGGWRKKRAQRARGGWGSNESNLGPTAC